MKRGADRHYPVMGKKRIRDTVLEIGLWRPAEHAHCYLWVTNNKLLDGAWLMNELGFTYKTNLCWAKRKFGLGQYFHGQHELMLFGVRGKGMHPSVMTKKKGLSTCMNLDHVRDEKNKIIHSAKPPEFRHERIEKRSKGPRLEIFARGPAPRGWTTWGREAA